MDDEGGWELVTRRKQRTKHVNNVKGGKMDIAGRRWNGSYEGMISFYFSAFPDTHGAREMLKAFAFYGKVIEVVIPFKRNKWEQRFGFVRFVKAVDPRNFAVKLDNIIIGENKIHVNVTRFERVTKQSTRSMPKREAEIKGQRKEWKVVSDKRGERNGDGGEGGDRVTGAGGNQQLNKEPRVVY